MDCKHPHWTREGNCEDCGARWDAPLDDAQHRIEDAARWLMGLIDDPSFNDAGFRPGTITDTLRRSGEVTGLRDALKLVPQTRVVPRTRVEWHDDSGDDDMKDGGIGVPGYGFARDDDPLPV